MALKRFPALEQFSWQPPVLSVANDGIATKGNRYIVGTDPVGEFYGLDTHDIAWYDGTDWQTDTPSAGWAAYNLDTSTYYRFDGTAWIEDADISTKMDLVGGATEDNVASFDAAGQVKDSGVSTPTFDEDLGVMFIDFPD